MPIERMPADLLRRIRWTNVARAAAVLLALALALAWPRLRAHQQPLPPAVEPSPVVEPSAAARTTRVAPPATPAPRAAVVARRAAARRTVARPAAQRRKDADAMRARFTGKHHHRARSRKHRPPRVARPAPGPATPASPAAEFLP